MMVDDGHLDSGDNYNDNDDSGRQSPSPNPSYSSVDSSPGHPAHQETGRPPKSSSPASSQTPLIPGAFHAENGSSSCILGSAPLPNEPAQPGPPVRGPAVSTYLTPLAQTIQEPLTSNSDPLPNEPPQPGPPVHDPAVSPIQTVQTYLTQMIQSNLTAILPGLVQGEVRMQCAQIAQQIGTQISSIREEVIRPTGDPDDPMLPSCEEDKGENEGSRGRGKRSARRSYNKRTGKEVRFGSDSDSEANEADEDDEGDEGISRGQKYKKKPQALRVSNYSCL